MTKYIGTELELFAATKNWKDYWIKKITPYVGNEILEVGAGKGANTIAMANLPRKKWICIEPDPDLARDVVGTVGRQRVDSVFDVVTGTIDCIEDTERFDTILYLDVLEHIEDDATELKRATQLLSQGGHLIVMSPALQCLFSKFDKKIGHFRRYSARTLKNVIPDELTVVSMKYLDSVGTIASLSNKYFLKQNTPTSEQLRFWDTKLVPLSRLVDPLLFFKFGKTILGIFRKTAFSQKDNLDYNQR